MNPTGHFIPPLLVFQRKYMKPELMNGTAPGQSTRAIHRGGYRARFTPNSFLISSNTQSRKKKILLP
jgi:hypothetical protein